MVGIRPKTVFVGFLHLAHLLTLVLPEGARGSIALPLEGSRFLLSLGTDPSEYFRAIQDVGYTCWLAPTSFARAMCIQNHDPLGIIAPDTAAELRRILTRVNLRKWLPDMLCGGERGTRYSNEAGAVSEINGDDREANTVCRGIVDASLMDMPPAAAWASGTGVDIVVSATIEDIPWIKVMEACVGMTWASGLRPFQCTTIVTMLASDRAKEQLLPALRKIALATTTADPRVKDNSSPSPKVVADLLEVLETNPTVPSLRIELPRPRGRTSGNAVVLVADVDFGTALEAELTGGHPSTKRCEVHVVVDGAVVHHVAVDSAQTSQSVAVAVVPVYGSRCSEHPAHAAMAAAAATQEAAPAGTPNEEIWYIEAREVEKVCTNDAFGPHRIHAELACCDDGGGEEDGDDDANTGARNAAGPGEGAASSSCEVLAIAAPVEYMHTANGAPVLSSLSEEESQETGPGAFLHPPPEDISVSLHLKHDPYTVKRVVAVPRWSSDGEVWEAAFEVCSKAFGPEQAVLVELNDCVDLVTSSVRDKRVDMYHRMVLHLEAYLMSTDPSLDRGEFEGHTGAFPEKVAALGAVSREGGERVNTVCEVGFNAGHSSLNWLLNTRPSTRLLAFDLGEHRYVQHAMDFLQAVFPGRLDVVLGDSSETVPAYARREAAEGRDPAACNVVFVDGNHLEDGAYADLINFQGLSSSNWHVLVVDDIDTRGVAAAWRRFKEEGRGRFARIVQATAEHYTQVQDKEGAEGSLWDAVFENKIDRAFMQMGYLSMGIGSYRPPAAGVIVWEQHY